MWFLYETNMKQGTRVTGLAYSLTLKMEGTSLSSTSVDFQSDHTVTNPRRQNSNNHCCENLESYKVHFIQLILITF
jgi:hypothetical protein